MSIYQGAKKIAGSIDTQIVDELVLQLEKNTTTVSEIINGTVKVGKSIVSDNSSAVDGFIVGCDVPADAKFTDTVYSHPSTHPASMISGLPSSLPANGGNADTVDGLHGNAFVPVGASCNKNWNWSGQGGQPTWLWGGNDPTNEYLYNPSNFNVNYANSTNYSNSTSNADMVDGFHIAGKGTGAPGGLAENALYFVYE